jgi:hypothetical protein
MNEYMPLKGIDNKDCQDKLLRQTEMHMRLLSSSAQGD